MQNNNNDNINKKKKSGSASDEIIEILDNYRQKNTNQNKPMGEAKENSADKNNKESLMSHFAENKQSTKINEEAVLNPINSHFSDTADKKELQKTRYVNKKERLKKEKKPAKKIFKVFGKSSLLFKALFYILFVLILSAYLSYYAIAIGNDVFALVKDEVTTTLKISPNATAEEVADKLEEKNIIDYAWAFKLYLKYRSDKEFEFVPGNHKLDASMNYTQIIHALTISRTERKQVRITVPEGFTVDQIIDRFIENGIGTREGFVDAINNYPYKHEFVKELEKLGYSENRKYRLEGYLYPDTYDFYTDTEECLIINKLLNNFSEKFWTFYKTQYKEVCDNHKMTFDELITLASMIQAEGNNALDFEYISYVFHNRLKTNSEELKYLQSDATIQYVLPEREKDSKELDTNFDNPYNTYKYKDLPPGAICNPGFDAIAAALYPSRPVNEKGQSLNAFYFVSNDAGKTYYAQTPQGHKINRTKRDNDNKAIKGGTYTG